MSQHQDWLRMDRSASWTWSVTCVMPDMLLCQQFISQLRKSSRCLMHCCCCRFEKNSVNYDLIISWKKFKISILFLDEFNLELIVILFFSQKGGKTVYFGELGRNSATLVSYLERSGAKTCSSNENPADYMLREIAPPALGQTGIDWPQAWLGKEISQFIIRFCV